MRTLASGVMIMGATPPPIDTSETKGPVGLTMRADAAPTLALSLLMQTIREAATAVSAKL